VPRFPPCRLWLSHAVDPTCRSDDTRSPWVTHASSPPCRPHTPWYDEEEPKRLRHHSAGSTIPHLGPTGSSVGWLPSMTTRWFSASPSDPPSREAPCPPERCTRWLQVPLGGLPLSRACPCRVLHTCLVLRPVRHYPHLWISTRGLGSSGTLTRLRRVLPGTHYGHADSLHAHLGIWGRLPCPYFRSHYHRVKGLPCSQ
jgi:hypothetical protein